MILKRIQYIFLFLVIFLLCAGNESPKAQVKGEAKPSEAPSPPAAFVSGKPVEKPYALTVETKKGDIIKGEFGIEKLKVELQLGGFLEISVTEIIDISGDKMDNLTFKLKDGMVLRGKIGDEKVTVKTRFGDITIPLSEIKSINIGAAVKEAPEVASKITPDREVIPEKKVSPEGDWRVDLRREEGVFHERFKIILQYVEKKGNILIVGISSRNISKGIQHLGLRHDYKDTTVLIDDDEGTEFKLRSVEGISERGVAINPGAMKLATFTFPFPQGVKKARFVSIWGAGAKYPSLSRSLFHLREKYK